MIVKTDFNQKSNTKYHVTFCQYNANDTRTRNRYRKPVPENLYRFSVGVSCESVSIFSGTEIWYGVEQCSTRCTVTNMTSIDYYYYYYYY